MSLTETASSTRVANLSDSLDGSPPYVIHGVAIGPGDVTKKKKKKKWPASTLKDAASTLQGRPLVRDHINQSYGVVGEVTKSKFKPNVGVVYEAELDDKKLAKKINMGRLDVSARIKHPKSENLEKDDDGALLVDRALFDNLSIVPTGASPSNKVAMGSAEQLSAVELREEFDYEVGNPPESENIYSENESYDIEELARHRYHIPTWRNTTKLSWDAPRMGDFDTDDLSEIADHFIVSTSGFPPEQFGDLKLPVVDEDGFLNLRALRIAKRVVSQISGGDDDLSEKVNLIANSLIKAKFPREPVTTALSDVNEDWSDEELSEYLREQLDIDMEVEELQTSTHTPSYSSVATGRSWDGLNLEDFDTDDLSEIDDHFIVSDSGFPPDNFSDLSFEVVDTDGALVREAVNSAWSLRGQSEADIENILLSLNDAFDDPPIDVETDENEEDVGNEDDEVEETDEDDDDPSETKSGTEYKRIVIEEQL